MRCSCGEVEIDGENYSIRVPAGPGKTAPVPIATVWASIYAQFAGGS